MGQMAALIQQCKVFIGNDSGPGHLAAALHVPVVCLFSGANLPKNWAPWPSGAPVTVLTHPVSCQPCELWDCPADRGHACMDQINVAKVVEETEKLIRATS